MSNQCGRAKLSQTYDDDYCPVQSSQAVESSSCPVLGSGPVSACKGDCADGAWQCGGELGIWALQHTNPRRKLETTCKLSLGPTGPHKLASVILTRGTCTDGTPFTTFDNRRNHETAHLDRSWLCARGRSHTHTDYALCTTQM